MEEDSEHCVFVYGTLKPGGHYWPKFCEGKVSAIVAARIRGELYDLHVGYPGLLARGQDWVEGFILSFPNPNDFAEVDRLEGYAAHRPAEENEYNRLKVPCFSPDGEQIGECWTYEMSEAAIERHQGSRLVDGVWPI